jgi:hypothetical protein
MEMRGCEGDVRIYRVALLLPHAQTPERSLLARPVLNTL